VKPVLRTRNVTSLQDTILRLMEAEEQVNQQIDELVIIEDEHRHP
jgi:hypothetical protein